MPLRASRRIVDASAPAQWPTSWSQTRGGWMTFDGYSWPATPSSRTASSRTDDERQSPDDQGGGARFRSPTETSRDPCAERWLLSLMDEQRVRGLITTTGHDNDDLIDRMASRGTQCVLLTRAPGQARQRMHSVHLDDRAAGALAARHLYALGRRRIAVLTSSPHLTTQRLRLDGVNSERKASSRRAGADSTLATEPDVDSVAKAIDEICVTRPRGRRPDALICTSGRLTLGAVTALRSSGVRVPDDLALVSFDDFPWAPLLDPALTVVDQRPQEMGIRATELILAEPAHDEPVEIVVPPSLIIRQSCGAERGQSAHLLAAPRQDA